jgi:uncharacterized protein
MEISEKTKIDDLLNQYPFLMDFFISKSSHFKNLKNPIMRKTIGKVATLGRAAAMGKLDLDDLVRGVAREIREKAGEEVKVMGEPAPGSAEGLGDPEVRQEVLKGIIRDLHKGEDMKSLKKRFQELVQHVSPSEIAHMEQKLIAEGMPETEVKRLCDVHVALFKEALEKHEIPGAPPGHPVNTLMKENRAAEAIMDEMDGLIKEVGSPPDEAGFQARRGTLADLLEKLSKIDLHYLKKENQLFPLLEAHEISGPSQVMWAIHDDVRGLLKKCMEAVPEKKVEEVAAPVKELLSAVREMIYKEEHILYPMSLETLSDVEWGRVRQGEEEIGYAWIEPEAEWSPEIFEKEEKGAPGEEKISLDTGYISRDLINLMLTHLPVDITLVDEQDRVAYYSQGKERIFPRSPGIIGRKVQRCHPPDSVDVVNRILEAFKSGKKDVAEFWLQLGEKFVYIRYFALHDPDGAYKGCLEVSQDISRIKQLEGQRRLLDWE